MARPSKLTESQWQEIERRLIEGAGVRALGKEYGISPGQISKRFPNSVSKSIQTVAEKLADAHSALDVLPMQHRALAVSLADKLRSISSHLASAAEYGAATAHRLNALANSEVAKVDDADVLSPESMEAMKGVAALTRLANDSSSIALNLLAANKDTVQRMNAPETTKLPRITVRHVDPAPRLEHADE